MTKMELAIQTVDWKIEAAQKDMQNMQTYIKMNIDKEHMMFEAESILAYAQKMNEAAKELRMLKEQRHMLECLAKQ